MSFFLDVNINKKLKEFDLEIEFKMHKGVLGILGASGCGKSMTLKSIAGIVDPDEGHIICDKVLFDSKSKVNMKPQERHVGYLFQSYALFPNMTVEQNIAVGLGKHYDQTVVNKMIKQFSLTGLEKRYPRQLSGGQQQRVALARILAYEPKIILLDEPFSAMDSFLKESLRLELSKVLKTYEGIAILVTHDRDEAYQLCDQLVLLDKGKVIRKGNTKDVFSDPQYVQAARLTGCKNISKIERIDDHHVKCLDWNQLVLETDKYIDTNITHIGIRAHDLIPCENSSINCIKCGNAEISEMPFEWQVNLENGLRWKTGKAIHNNDKSNVIPEYFTVDPKNILLLKEV